MFRQLKGTTLLSFALIGALVAALFGFVPNMQAYAACGTTYTVQSGDTLLGIAKNCGISYSALLRANPDVSNSGVIYPGEQLLLPGAIQSIPGTGNQLYIVQSGDTFLGIALQFGVTYSQLLAANPDIQDPNLILPGEQIVVPTAIIPITGSQPELVVTPTTGVAGTQVSVKGDGFPANTNIRLGAGMQDTSVAFYIDVMTDAQGNLSGQLTIPSDSAAGAVWIVQARTSDGSGLYAETHFDVLPVVNDRVYTVQPGDTLVQIAQTFGTTVDVLLRANPDLSNPSLIIPGEQVLLPGAVETLSNGQTIYIVDSGDNLTKIAQRFGTTVSAILADNTDITDANVILVGQRLNLPVSVNVIPITGSQVYTVVSGDSLSQIAAEYGVTLIDLINANPQISDPNLIYPGQQIVIP
jgi:spore coat assembly protein SafA